MAATNGHASKKSLFPLIINNEDVYPDTTFDVLDPVHASVTHAAPDADVSHALAAVEGAEKAFERWRDSTPLERRTILNKAVEIMNERKQELVSAMVKETGRLKIGLTWTVASLIKVWQVRSRAGLDSTSRLQHRWSWRPLVWLRRSRENCSRATTKVINSMLPLGCVY